MEKIMEHGIAESIRSTHDSPRLRSSGDVNAALGPCASRYWIFSRGQLVAVGPSSSHTTMASRRNETMVIKVQNPYGMDIVSSSTLAPVRKPFELIEEMVLNLERHELELIPPPNRASCRRDTLCLESIADSEKPLNYSMLQ